MQPIRFLIGVYFWLLLVEGVLRKWILPGFSDWIFVIRDPVVLVIYLMALRARVFPLRPAVAVVVLMVILSLAFALTTTIPPVVLLFGLRTNYLHLPLIFVMASVLTRQDVIRIGRWCLIAAIPIVGLMVLQFNASPTHWLNATAGAGEGQQLRGAMGKIRPPGPFSFITGAVAFFGLASAFAVDGWLRARRYPRWVLLLGTAAIVLAVPVSISRSMLLAVLIVTVFGLATMIRDLRKIPRLLGPVVALGALVTFAADSIYVQAFVTRWNESIIAGKGDFYGNVVTRLFDPFLRPFEVLFDTPMFGHGIGMGTVAGARLMTGKFNFLLSESELSRIVLELGPPLGMTFVAWRAWMAFSLVRGSWRAVLERGESLPWLITGASFLGVLIGQWGPATTLGFAIFGAGLALAALNDPGPEQG